MELTEKRLDEIIKDIWTNHIKNDFLERRILYYESTLVAAFYRYLRNEIDKYQNLRIFLEWHISEQKEDKKTTGHCDLVIMKIKDGNEWSSQEHLRVNENATIWAIFEFKFIPDLKLAPSQKDFQRLKDIKNKNTKRAYLVCIYERLEGYILLSKDDKWINNYYRECNATLKYKTWNFEFKLGEEML